MSVHKSSQPITADGSYEFTVIPGRSYLLEPYYASGTGTVTVFSGIEGLGYDHFVATQVPDSATAISIAATTTVRSYRIWATGNRIRLTIASASSLNLIPMLTEVPHGY